MKRTEINSFYELLNAALVCAEKEKCAIADGKASPWSLGQINNVIVPEISELLSHADKGEVCFRFGRKQRLLESTYLITDSLNDLSQTALGKSILKLQDLYNAL